MAAWRGCGGLTPPAAWAGTLGGHRLGRAAGDSCAVVPLPTPRGGGLCELQGPLPLRLPLGRELGLRASAGRGEAGGGVLVSPAGTWGPPSEGRGWAGGAVSQHEGHAGG